MCRTKLKTRETRTFLFRVIIVSPMSGRRASWDLDYLLIETALDTVLIIGTSVLPSKLVGYIVNPTWYPLAG